ncbi:MAG: transcription elongation factor GreA [Clostridia bacterium]|nr:transcription elongation factor GreA [Clostridia bacterium]
MAEQKKRITAEGLRKLQDELDHRIGVTRNEIAKEIEFARSYGDLSENAEYTEAKNKQTENETRIAYLQDEIARLEVVSDDEINTDTVSVGTTVRVLDQDQNEEIEYSIVGAQESDPFNNRISDESAVGHALVGLRVGDVAEVEVPVGILHFEVLEIKR